MQQRQSDYFKSDCLFCFDKPNYINRPFDCFCFPPEKVSTARFFAVVARFFAAADHSSADRFWEADHCAAAARISALPDAAAVHTSVLRGAVVRHAAVDGVLHAERAANRRAEFPLVFLLSVH